VVNLVGQGWVNRDRLKGIVIYFSHAAAIFMSGWSYIKARREYRGCGVEPKC
jgi:hypothetical protein